MKLMRVPTLLLALALLIAFTVPAWAQDTLTIASGAGYKKMVEELCAAFTAETGIEPQKIYGNMGQITAQAEQSGMVDLLIGDKTYLDGTDLAFAEETLIGQGRLMLAVADGVEVEGLAEAEILNADNAAALLGDPAITRIAHPDSKKAIYGRAATQFLTNLGLIETLADKLLEVGTVPQVSAYAVSGEVDFGFINLTDALAIEDEVARIIPVEESLYEPILIVAKTLADAPDTEAVAAFRAFLASEAAREIAKRHGL